VGTVVGKVGQDWNRYGGIGAVELVRVGLTAKCGAMTREVGNGEMRKRNVGTSPVGSGWARTWWG